MIPKARRRSSRIDVLNGVGNNIPQSELPWYCQANFGYNNPLPVPEISNRKRRTNSLTPPQPPPVDSPWPGMMTTPHQPALNYSNRYNPRPPRLVTNSTYTVPRIHRPSRMMSFIRGKKELNSQEQNIHENPARNEVITVYRSDKKDAKTLKALFSGSNVPGLRELALSDNIARKIYWLLAFLGLGFICLSDIHSLMSEFFSYPVTVDVRLKEERKLPFPLVTFCNLNTVRFSAICNATQLYNISIPYELKIKLCGASEKANNTEEDMDINDILNDNSKKDVVIDTDLEIVEGENWVPGPTPAVAAPPSTESISPDHKAVRRKRSNRKSRPDLEYVPIEEKKDDKLKKKKHKPGEEDVEEIELTERQEKELQENLTTWLAVMANADKDLTMVLGHQLEDMLLRCTIKSNNCTDPRNFRKTFSPSEGNCYTYKSYTYVGKKKTVMKPTEISLAGVDHGLELVLNLEANEYLPGSAQTGALILIHTSEDFATTVGEAVFVAPLRTTYIGMKKTKITRLPSPYPEHCVDDWPAAMNISEADQGLTYSQQVCLKICLQQSIDRNCKCQSATLPQLKNTNETIRFCDTRKGSQYIFKTFGPILCALFAQKPGFVSKRRS